MPLIFPDITSRSLPAFADGGSIATGDSFTDGALARRRLAEKSHGEANCVASLSGKSGAECGNLHLQAERQSCGSFLENSPGLFNNRSILRVYLGSSRDSVDEGTGLFLGVHQGGFSVLYCEPRNCRALF